MKNSTAPGLSEQLLHIVSENAMKRFLHIIAGILALPMCVCSCAGCVSSVAPGNRTDSIPDPTRLDLTAFSNKLFKAAFAPGNSADPKLDTGGVLFVGNRESRDPSVVWNISKMYKAAGYPVSADGKTYVPFTPEEKKVFVFKIQAEWGGAFEMFYATEGRSEAQAGFSLTESYGGDSEFFGERTAQYVVFDGTGANGWMTRFNDGFRLDYTNFLREGDAFLVEKIAICRDRAEADEFIAAEKGEPEPVPAVEAGFYVCRYEDRLHVPEDNVLGSPFENLEDAVKSCDRSRHYGYRVANEKGEIVYTPYSLLVCNLLREGYYIVNYAREQEFKYGDSCTNPAINHRPKNTSCDRLMDWIVYRAGFTYEHPLVQGCVVANLHVWCKKMGFEKITDVNELKAGDIVFVRPAADGGPQHVFMLASDVKAGSALRYDHGSDTRIMNPDQPTYEPVSYPDAPFIFAYRPVATPENNSMYDYYNR